jgi:hypothetical protein
LFIDIIDGGKQKSAKRSYLGALSLYRTP